MKQCYIFILLVFITNLLAAQTAEQIKANPDKYWGEGTGRTLDRAEQEALSMLINQISVWVRSDFTHLMEETTTDGHGHFEETYQGVIKTYSSAALRNTRRLVISNEPDAVVLLYIHRSEADKIFRERERKLIEFYQNGKRACKEHRVADALRYYYWSLTLLRSHPHAGNITVNDEHENEVLLLPHLHARINQVFHDINIAVSDIQKEDNLTTYVLNIRYRGKPAQNFAYTYFTGRDWTNIYSARDGLGLAQFSGTHERRQIQLRAEYVFRGETAIDNELRDVMMQLDIVPFRNSVFNVSIDDIAESEKEQPLELAQKEAIATASVSQLTDAAEYIHIMHTLADAIRAGDHAAARPLFTDEGFEVYEKILQYGQAQILREPEFHFLHFEGGVICRSIPMSFHFPGNNRTFVEDVVFHFNEDKKIFSLAFGLGDVPIADILGRDVWSERVRLVLINFMEHYKTAFALKRLDYIESIFSDDALIITGTVLRADHNSEIHFRDHHIVRHNYFDKERYINHLRHVFDRNEFINIRFSDNEVRKAGRGREVYGIQIRQDYFSTNYGDTGYLFLMIDFADPDLPMIHVRTWQKEKCPNGTVYGLGDFF